MFVEMIEENQLCVHSSLFFVLFLQDLVQFGGIPDELKSAHKLALFCGTRKHSTYGTFNRGFLGRERQLLLFRRGQGLDTKSVHEIL